MKPLRVVFMGTPDFALPALRALYDSVHEVVAVYCQPPRPAGRGHKIQLSPTHIFANEHHIPVLHPKSLRNPEAQKDFLDLKPDVAVVAAYGLILPQEILDIPRFGCINIHGSLLPRWRGAAPIHRAIQAGDTKTGVTIMQMDAGLDTGAMLTCKSVLIEAEDTTGLVHDKLADLGGGMIVSALEGVTTGSLKPIVQPEEGVTYAHKISKDESRLDFFKPACQLARDVRAFNPYPGSWFEIRGERIKVLKAVVVPCNREPGMLDVGIDHVTVTCGEDGLSFLQVQKSGSKPMGISEFLRGYPLMTGERVS